MLRNNKDTRYCQENESNFSLKLKYKTGCKMK